MSVGDALARTPLHYAILFGNAEAAKLLLRRGASRCVTQRWALWQCLLVPSLICCDRAGARPPAGCQRGGHDAAAAARLTPMMYPVTCSFWDHQAFM